MSNVKLRKLLRFDIHLPFPDNQIIILSFPLPKPYVNLIGDLKLHLDIT